MKLILVCLLAVKVMAADIPVIPERNFLTPYAGQEKRVYVVIDVDRASLPSSFVTRMVSWEVSEEGVAYKVYVQYSGEIQQIYITPSASQRIKIPKTGAVRLWVTSFNHLHVESSPSEELFLRNGKEHKTEKPGRE